MRKKKRLSWWTVFGKIAVEERIWRSSTESFWRVFAPVAGIIPQGKSRALHRALSDFGVEHSFGQAAERFREHYGFTIPVSAVRAATLASAARAQAGLEAKYEESYRVLPALGSEQVVAEGDGTMICTVAPGPRDGKRPREWKEMRLMAAQSQGSTLATYAAGFLEVGEAGRRWGHCGRDAGWGLQSHIHVVADGAEWIRKQAAEVFGGQHQMLCDFYHVSEYLAAAAKSVAPITSERWRKTQQRRLKKGAAAKVIATLKPHEEEEGTAKENAPVGNALRYLQNRADHLDYRAAIAAGLPIGSGLIESGHRHVLQSRLKKAGTAWLPDNAHAISQLRVIRSNGNWNSLWV